VIGSSTGGTEALRVLLTQLPENIPPILIVQHIPPVFSLAFANRLNELCPFLVKEAEDDDIVEPNKVLIAPGGKQMAVVKVGGVLKIKITDEAPVNRHKPSVDYLFASVAKLNLSHVVGVILTGMGGDGARELLALKKLGARTIAQNQETCIVWGMPREAAKMGAAEFILALDAIPQKIMDLIP
jgi:two-component system chemotaxis response regulator CheB